LIVHAPFRRRRLVRAEVFIAADPLRRRLHLEPNGEERTANTGKAAISGLIATALWARRTFPPLARRAAVGVATLCAWLRPHARKAIRSALRIAHKASVVTRAILVWLSPRVRDAATIASDVAISACVVFVEVGRRLLMLAISFTQELRMRRRLVRERQISAR
jgi:hypothetical protein